MDINTSTNKEKVKIKYNKFNKLAVKEWIAAYIFLLPALAFFVIFVVIPMGEGIIMSFMNYTLRKKEWIGLGNYIKIFNDPVFKKSLVNTLVLVLGNVPCVLIFSLFVATTVYKRSSKMRSFF